jgi:hypothetical protein
VERYAPDGFAGISRDGLWLLHICSLAECCVLVGDARRGRELYELLTPYRDRSTVSYTLQPFGPVALRLGMLAAMFGDWDAAERHLRTARERCELLGARGVVPRVLYEHARMLAARGDVGAAAARFEAAASLAAELDLTGLLERIGTPGVTPATPVFRREGELWEVRYEGDVFSVRDVKGLRYLAVLLASPGREIHAVELAQAIEGVQEPVRVGESVGPALDAQAKQAYRRRLEELGEELDQARRWADPERASRAQDEIDALTDELTSALGLGGRDRAFSSPAERARVSVTKAIRSAIRTIDRHSPALGSHLSDSVRTGQFCSYAPPGELPPRWRL